MTQTNSNGAAQTVTTEDFNARVKRMLVGKVDPQPKAKPAPRRFNKSVPTPASN